MFGFIVWNIDPDIVALGAVKIRYYGLLFATGFILGYRIIQKIAKKEGFPEEWVDKLLMYVMVGTVLGARLGHCLFYEPAYYLSHPLSILKVWEGGLASHGGAIGILVALYLFSKKVSKKSMLWALDRLMITVAIAGALIRTGNLMNSEIYGQPTKSESGIVYAHDTRLTRAFEGHESYRKNIDNISYLELDGESPDGGISWPMDVKVTFDRQVQNEQLALNALNYQIKPLLVFSEKTDGSISNIYADEDAEITFAKERGVLVGTIKAWGIPKHPTHLYEALMYLIGFFVLWWMYWKKDAAARPGLLFGVFLEFIFLSRFFIEFIKENQVDFETSMPINMGQWLSLPLIIVGFFFIIRAMRTRPLNS